MAWWGSGWEKEENCVFLGSAHTMFQNFAHLLSPAPMLSATSRVMDTPSNVAFPAFQPLPCVPSLRA